MNIKFDHLNLTVRNLEESMTWYKNIFGMEFKEGDTKHATKAWAIIGKDDTFLCMYEYPQLTSATETGDVFHRIDHLGIRVSDDKAWEAIVTKYQLKLHYGGINTYPHSSSWYLVDPSGHSIEVSFAGNEPLRFT